MLRTLTVATSIAVAGACCGFGGPADEAVPVPILEAPADAPGSPPPPTPADPAAPMTAPTRAELEGLWHRLHEDGGRDVMFTGWCEGGPHTVQVYEDTLRQFSGQEEQEHTLGASRTEGDALVVDVGGSEVRVRWAPGRVLVWEGPPFYEPWRTTADPKAYPQVEECCFGGEGDPAEDVTSVIIPAGTECPPQ